MQSDPTIAAHVAALHASGAPKIFSLIVTILGDVVMRQGVDRDPKPVWVGHLVDLMGRLDIEAGLVRTSLSRLVAAGLIHRDKRGRNTFYRLNAASAAAFAEAADRIYGRRVPPPAEAIHLAAIDRCADRRSAREALEAMGFRRTSATVLIAPARTGSPPGDLPEGAMLATAPPSPAVVAAVREAWRLDALDAEYRSFRNAFASLPAEDLAPEAAIVARVVLVHRMRRLILRDPGLSDAFTGRDWPGPAARALFARRLDALQGASERFVTDRAWRNGGAPEKHIT